MTYIPEKLRRRVNEIAQRRCEYCLLDERCAGKPHEVDHICAEKHGGDTTLDNLCLSCFDCNRHKGSDLCSLDVDTDVIVPLFHPRQHIWSEHFRLNGAFVEALSPTGRVTIRLLQINDDSRKEEREILLRLGRYPVYPQGK
ncbi:MAG: HNH endonuclease [Anaerolineae bacterium]|nr:HNH endonuclease [Anaerolineae bacterium]